MLKKTKFYNDLHSYLKENRRDAKFTQAMLGGLPKVNMQKYHRERSADPEYQHFINEETIEDVDVPEQIENETLQEGSELVRTCDIFGKDLSSFR